MYPFLANMRSTHLARSCRPAYWQLAQFHHRNKDAQAASMRAFSAPLLLDSAWFLQAMDNRAYWIQAPRRVDCSDASDAIRRCSDRRREQDRGRYAWNPIGTDGHTRIHRQPSNG